MPHLVLLYTPNLDDPGSTGGNISVLCRALADTMCAQRDAVGKPVFPTGGVRVLAYAAKHFAVADGARDYAFVYLNLRMGRGRDAQVLQDVGLALEACTKAHFAPLLASRLIGVTLQIDEGKEIFDAKNSSIHPLFSKKG